MVPLWLLSLLSLLRPTAAATPWPYPATTTAGATSLHVPPTFSLLLADEQTAGSALLQAAANRADSAQSAPGPVASSVSALS